jgi:20S proteasome alpha/beta subunit
MDALFAMETKDFVLLASDGSFKNNVVVSRTDPKNLKITEHTALMCSGNQGDCLRVSRAIREKVKVLAFRDGLQVSECMVATLLQNEIYKKLRTRERVEVESIVGGVSEGKGRLYSVDVYGALMQGKYFASGYGKYLWYAAMDHRYREDMTLNEAIALLREIYAGVKSRLAINYRELDLVVITRDGMSRMVIP